MTEQLNTQRPARGLPWGLADLLLWAPAAVVATWVRLDFQSLVIPEGASWVVSVFAVMILVHLGLGLFLGVYRIGRRRDSLGRLQFGLVSLCAVSAGIVGTLLISLGPDSSLPRSIPFISSLFVVVGAFGLRAARLLWSAFGARHREPVIIYGGGEVGRRIIGEMSGPDHRRFTAKVVLDDDPSLKGSFVNGIRVRGGLDQLPEVVQLTGARVLVVAIAHVSPTTQSRITKLATSLGLRVFTVPSLDEITSRGSIPLQELDLATLMGREQVTLDEDAIRSLIQGRRVLVTGAGGSIGSELSRQVNRFEPAELTLLDRDEGGLHQTQLSLTGQALLDSGNIVLADIRNAERIHAIFQEKRPEVVLHAAALKHQPLLEMYPGEAWLTNVKGTDNVLAASAACRASVVVNVSTDKAANPTCVLGDSKRVAERLTAAYGEVHEGQWVSVRFGNVLGSRGSVIHTFRSQIERGGPITITDPEVRRYFMTIPEASQLVLQAAVVGRTGETLVLDMGEPMPILNLARALMGAAGREDLPIVYTGLRAGEKLSEELLDDRETPVRADRHPLITEVRVEPLDVIPMRDDWDGTIMRGLARADQLQELREI